MTDISIVKGQPIVLPNGDVINPTEDTADKVVKVEEKEQVSAADADMAELMSALDEGNYSETFKRTMADMTVDTKQMTTSFVIMSYTMWGLDDAAISILLKVSIDDIEDIKTTEHYTRLHKELLEGIRYAEEATIHGYLTQRARKAAIVMGAALTSKSVDVRMTAAKDILDRTGFRPADKVEHTHRFEDELQIVLVSEKETKTIDVSVEM